MSFFLSGFFCLTEPTPGRLQIAIPFFRSNSSNKLFVQNLESKFRIEGFYEFSPHDHYVVELALPEIIKSIGDTGIISFLSTSGRPIFGQINEIVNHLYKLLDDLPVFLAMDLANVNKDRDLYFSSMKKLRDSMPSSLYDWWVLFENELEDKAFDIDIDFRHDLERNLPTWDNPSWPNEWRKLWRETNFAADVAEVGLDYANQDDIPSGRRIRVLSDVLQSKRRRSRTRRLASYAESVVLKFLSGTDFNSISKKNIGGKILHLSYNYLGSKIVDKECLFFLEDCLSKPSKLTSSWGLLWTSLHRDRPDSERILALAEKALFHEGRQDVEARIIKTLMNSHNSNSHYIVKNWLEQNFMIRNIWADAYKSTLKSFGPNQKLLRIGANWLSEEPGHRKKWCSMYELIIDTFGDSPDLDAILIAWVKRANFNLPIWDRLADIALRKRPGDNDLQALLAQKRMLKLNM